MKLGLQIPSFTNPNGPAHLGPELATIARMADDGGFEYVGVMDHVFQIGMIGPPELAMLEAYTTLGFLAAHTARAKLLTVVTGAFYRWPGMLGKQVTTLDVLSGGRAVLGIGAGWNEEEARGLGVPFPPLAERFERLEETLRIVRQMFRGDDSPFEGKHYHLERPLNSPAPLSRPAPPILIGGSGERKTLRLVAKYADACNLFAGPELPRKLEVLREHCEREGRNYDDITKTVVFSFDPGADGSRVPALLDGLRGLSELGIQAAIGGVNGVFDIAPLEVMIRDVIPVAAEF